MLALLASPIARYVAGAAFVVGLLGYTYHLGRSHGSASVRAQYAAEQERKLRDATKADDDALRCALSPECLRSNDGWRRKD
jgi:hypothetical protein